MFEIVAPVFLLVLVGYCFGRLNTFSAEAEKLLNTYVMYVALPALLFLPVAQADAAELLRQDFVIATLSGIAIAYALGLLLAKSKGVKPPQSSLVAMTACYGTTGYMGIPILITAYGPDAAVPAAIATVLHNVPAIMAVIISHEVGSASAQGSYVRSVISALSATARNPLTLAVLAGCVFGLLKIPLPEVIRSFTAFLGNAAGPTALFALGLGLARINLANDIQGSAFFSWIAPVLTLKLVVQPATTAMVLLLCFGSTNDVWLAAAVVMAAQPIGAGAYVFASRYGFFARECSIAIVISLLLGIATLTQLLSWVAPS